MTENENTENNIIDMENRKKAEEIYNNMVEELKKHRSPVSEEDNVLADGLNVCETIVDEKGKVISTNGKTPKFPPVPENKITLSTTKKKEKERE